MPPPAPLPSGRVVAPLGFVPAPYSSSPECRYPPQTAPGSASPGLGSPAQLPSPRCFPSSSGLCVSPTLVRPATACPRVSPAPCLPCLGLCPSRCLCLSYPHLVPSLWLFLPLSGGHAVSASMSPSFPPSIPPSSHLFSASPCHAISASLYGHVSNPISLCLLHLCFLSPSLCLCHLRLCLSRWSLPLPVSLPPPHLCCSSLPAPGTSPARGPPPTAGVMTRSLLWPRGRASLLCPARLSPISSAPSFFLGPLPPTQAAFCPTGDPTLPVESWARLARCPCPSGPHPLPCSFPSRA